MWRKYHPPLGGSTTPAITLDDVDDVVVRDCEAQAGTGTFLALGGAKTQKIEPRDNAVRKAKVAVMKGDDVSAA